MSENIYNGPYPPSSPEGKSCDRLECKSESRRGRPKAATITNLIIEGATSQSGIRCEVCSRVFPRDKSLQAHRRVHTGERPYSCDFPGCMRKFKQSGQLKTHQRLHTGERPFLCSAEGCTSRFTHANRHCSSHPQAPLIRSEDQSLLDFDQANHSQEVKQWLIKYRAERETRSVEKKEIGTPLQSKPRLEMLTPKTEDRELADMTNFTSASDCSMTANQIFSGVWSSPHKSPIKTPRLGMADRTRPVKNLFFTEPTVVSPRKRELPKKRWLRIACREAAAESTPTYTANLIRPTVLRHSSSFHSPPQEEHRPTWSLLTPPYSDEKQLPYDTIETEEEELAIPLPPVQHHIDIFGHF